jgi:hypothetical protein
MHGPASIGLCGGSNCLLLGAKFDGINDPVTLKLNNVGLLAKRLDLVNIIGIGHLSKRR